MYASSRVREAERRSASACDYESSTAYITESTDGDGDDGGGKGRWKEIPGGGGGGGLPPEASVPVTSLEFGTTIRVAPMERARGGWDDEHFHDRLRLPEGSPAGRGLVVTLEATARECVAVALSPRPHFEMGKTYAIHFGAAGNLSTVLRRRLPTATEAVDAAFPGRVCSDSRFVPYWIVLQGGILSAGVGAVPGVGCVASLDDRLYHQLRSGVDAARFVGIGNSALGRGARDLRVRNVRVMPIPASLGAGGVLVDDVAPVNVDDDAFGSAGGGGGGGAAPDAELLAEYERECEKARARAEKFGTEYRQPPPDAFFKWSEARKMRANPERGFITGMDIMSPEERAKAERRKERFADENKKRKPEFGPDGVGGDEGGEMDDGLEEGEAEGTDAKEREPLPVEQAWHNEELVGPQRMDPPEYLYAILPAKVEQQNALAGGDAEFKRAVPVPEKIHLFSIDWAAFKQIRSEDVMAHFAVYGPSYVEWLGELSCNVHFEDKYSAARALAALSQELPSPPPEGAGEQRQDAGVEVKDEENMEAITETTADSLAVVKDEEVGGNAPTEGDDKEAPPPLQPSDLGRMGWRLCLQPVRKMSNDRFGRRGTRARVLVRVATSEDVLVDRPTERPRPPPGFTTRRVLGPGSDFDTRWRHRRRGRGDSRTTKRQRRGARGDSRRRRRGDDDDNWERDRYDDRYDDHHDDRSEEDRWQRDRYDDHYEDDRWESDDDHKATGQVSGDYHLGETSDAKGGEQLPAGLERGLKATRAGFSVEEMEKEREAKRRAKNGEVG